MNNEKFIRKWEKSRKKGKFRYVITACITSILGSFVGFFIGMLVKEGYSFNLLTESYFITYIVVFLGSIVGAGIGTLAKWSRNEEKYNNLIIKKCDIQYKEF